MVVQAVSISVKHTLKQTASTQLMVFVMYFIELFIYIGIAESYTKNFIQYISICLFKINSRNLQIKIDEYRLLWEKTQF